MTKVLGIDPSTAATGLALPDGSFRTLKPTSGPDDKPRRRHELYTSLRHVVSCWPTDVAVIELVLPHGASAHAQLELAKLAGVFQLALFELGVPFAEVNPMSLKRYATAKGTAQKEEMMKAARNAGARVSDDNQADAHFLRQMGRDWYDLNVEEWQALETHQQEILEGKVAWPKL